MKISMASIYNWYRNNLRHPKYRWWIIAGTLVYLISPIDISPDFIPIVGEIDDLMLATLLVTELSQMFLARFKASESEDVSQDAKGKNTVEVEAETVATET